jgi:hypothetical protein
MTLLFCGRSSNIPRYLPRTTRAASLLCILMRSAPVELCDTHKIDGGEQAQREKRRERLPVFALEAARPASDRKTQHHEAGNPTNAAPDAFISDPNSSRASNDGATTPQAPAADPPAAATPTGLAREPSRPVFDPQIRFQLRATLMDA